MSRPWPFFSLSVSRCAPLSFRTRVRVYDLFISFSLSLDCLVDRISRTLGFTLHKHEREKHARAYHFIPWDSTRENLCEMITKANNDACKDRFSRRVSDFFSFCLLSNRKDDFYFTNEYCKCFSRFSFSLLLFHSWSNLFSSSHGSSRFVSPCFSILFILGPARFDSLAFLFFFLSEEYEGDGARMMILMRMILTFSWSISDAGPRTFAAGAAVSAPTARPHLPCNTKYESRC